MSRRILVSTLGASALLVSALAAAPAASALSAAERMSPASTGATAVDVATGTFYGINPTRFLDTRKTASKLPLAKGSTTTLQIGGRADSLGNTIPASGVSAAVINLTAVTTTSQGYFTVYPADAVRPTASSINFPRGWTGANMVTVPVSADGKVKIYNYGGAAHAIVDVLGWYAKDDSVQAAKGIGTQFLPATETSDPVRLYDSRKDTESGSQPFVGGEYLELVDKWATEEAARDAKAYVLNVTAVDATKDGVLTLWDGVGSKPTVSSVNYVSGTIAPNMAVVPARYFAADLDPKDGTNEHYTAFRLQNTGSGSVHIVVDLVGYYLSDQTEGLRFVPRSTPKRLVDTRKALGPDTVLSGPFGTTARTVNATSVSTGDSYFLVANTTGVLPTKRTYVTVYSGDSARPLASNVNINAGAVRSASTYAPLSYTSGPPEKLTFKVYNNAGSMHLVMDVAGTLDYYSSAAAPAGVTAAEASARMARSVDASERSFERH